MTGLDRALGALAIPLFLLCPRPAAGAEDPPVVTLPEVEVRLPRTAPQDPTSAATVVDAARFAGEPKDVAALVSTAPGVAVQDYGGLGQLATVSLRGASADGVKVLLDGLPLNTAAGGSVDLSTIPTGWVDRIEVVRGAEGARYGAGAMGGVVHVVTRTAAAGEWSARAAAGSFGTGSAAADVGLGGEGWGGLVGLSADTTRGDFPYRWDTTPSLAAPTWDDRTRRNADATSGGLLAKGFARAGAGRLDGALQLSGGERGLPGPPGNETPEQRLREARAVLAGRWARPLTPALELDLGADGRAEAVDLVPGGGAPTDRQRDLAGTARAELRLSAGAHSAGAGLSAGGERFGSSQAGDARHRWEVAAWVADELLLLGGRLRLAPALRAERLGPFTGWSGKLGGALGLAGPLSLRASAGRTFRAPTFAELYLDQGAVKPNPLLRPETALTGDAALAADAAWGLASLGAFVSRYDDLVVYEPSVAQTLKPFNLGRALARGIEAELATARLGRLGATAQLTWTWLRAETLRGPENELHKDVPHRARQRLFARLGLAPGGWELHAEAHYVGLQYQDALNQAAIPAALLFHGGGGVRLWRAPDVWLQADVKNAADDRTLQNGFGYPLPGRTVMVALRGASRGARDDEDTQAGGERR